MYAVAISLVMVSRIINGLEIEIDEKEANEVYLPKDFVDSLGEFDGDIEVLKDNIFRWNGNNQYMPLSILWELTNNCNFKCPFCYINTDLAQRFPYVPFAEAKKIIDELVRLGMLFCCLTGGECLLHPDFLRIYKYLKQKGVLVTVFTNGSLLNREIIELFREYKPYKIEASIYGVSEKIFSVTTNTTGKWHAKDILQRIELLKNEGINIICKSPITTLNASEVSEIRNWCMVRGIAYYMSEEILPSNEGESREKYAVKEWTGYEVRKSRDYKFDYKRAWECSAGKYAGVIGSGLCFYPCLVAVGIKRFAYSMKEGIGDAVEKHRNQVEQEKGKRLFFCKGCEWCNICKQCILTIETENEDDIKNNCMKFNNF